jgi:hypothetical protein
VEAKEAPASREEGKRLLQPAAAAITANAVKAASQTAR